MAKPKRRKASLHSTGKVVEADILARARDLAADPSLATPVCEGKCILFCPFKRARSRNLKIHAARENDAKLARYARSGPRLSRAYAACLIVAREEKLPYIAELRMPFGNFPYAMRGKTTPLELAGLQHHDDRGARLLSVTHAVKKRGLHVYSTSGGLVCTGRSPKPPAGFVREELEDLDLTERGGGRWVCEHGGADRGEAVVIHWESAGATAEICGECADESNSLHAILSHVAAPQARKEFRVEARLPPLQGEGAPHLPDASEAVVREYTQGAIGDRALLDRAHEARSKALRDMSGRSFVAGDRWFGTDATAFVDALDAPPLEREALAAAVRDVDRPVVVDRVSPVRALAEVWRDRGLVALTAVAGGDAATARSLYDPEDSPEGIAEALRKAAAKGSRARVDAALPRFKRLPGAAATADAIARAYRADGTDAARRLAQAKAGEGRDRGVALAFLKVIGSSAGQAWKFGHVDQDVAIVLEPHARALLECAPAEYAEKLDTLARLAGATESVETA